MVEIQEFTHYEENDEIYVTKFRKVTQDEFQALREEKLYDKLLDNGIILQWNKHLFIKCCLLPKLNAKKELLKEEFKSIGS